MTDLLKLAYQALDEQPHSPTGSRCAFCYPLIGCEPDRLRSITFNAPVCEQCSRRIQLEVE